MTRVTSPGALPAWQRRVIADSRVPHLLATRPAIVLERLARGGGATDWYYCRDITQLAELTTRLRPGSVVSFFFDDRITHAHFGPEVRDEMLGLMRDLRGRRGQTGEIVLGWLDDDLHLAVDFPSSTNELDESVQAMTPRQEVFYGAFPGRDDDGVDAVTLRLPDVDGVVRPHPR